jgi:hypothetical protein
MLKIERTGGLAGMGGPGARMVGRGQCDANTLPPADLKTINGLFSSYGKGHTRRSPSSLRDGFNYRISRTTAGVEETIEVPEHEVPAALIHCVKDELV